MITRTASCACGQLKVVCEGDPLLVGQCHCRSCQRRTGSAFGLAAFFPTEQITVSGESAEYVQVGGSGKNIRQHFCQTCGSTVYWFPEKLPGRVAVAVGAFADPDFPPPDKSVFEETKHPWVGCSGDN